MNKVTINMMGGGFQHAPGSSGTPQYVEWDKSGNANISMYIDNAIKWSVDKSKKNYAWFCESSSIISNLVNTWAPNNVPYLEENYELIFTHDKRLLPLSDKIKLVLPNAVPWIKDRKVHHKTKLISMIASNKKYCAGHIYRHQIVEKYKDKIDCFGGIVDNHIDTKEQGLNDYCFSIAIENDNYPNIFTEKITDCFATGTIPIFWGTPTIGEFFNEMGIISLTDDFKVGDLSTDLYYSKMEFILDNFERAIKLPFAEDYILEQYIQ